MCMVGPSAVVDFSRAGHVDARARPVVALVNRHPSFFTTSSCAGRVSLFADPTSASRAAGRKGGEWQELTLVHFSAQRKHISWDTFGAWLSRSLLDRGTRVGDPKGLG
jgi:tRNA(Phe) wybutosine-synthesizing methylase Tyw3